MSIEPKTISTNTKDAKIIPIATNIIKKAHSLKKNLELQNNNLKENQITFQEEFKTIIPQEINILENTVIKQHPQIFESNQVLISKTQDKENIDKQQHKVGTTKRQEANMLENTTINYQTKTSDSAMTFTSSNKQSKDSANSFQDELKTINLQEVDILENQIVEEKSELPNLTKNVLSSDARLKDEQVISTNAVKEIENQDLMIPKTTEAEKSSSGNIQSQKPIKETKKPEMTKVASQNAEEPSLKIQTVVPLEIVKPQLADKKEKIDKELKDLEKLNPIEELSSEIAVLNVIKSEIKSDSNFKLQDKIQIIGVSKTVETSDKKDYSRVIKMDAQDVLFFLNLSDNQQMIAQSAQTNVQNANQNADFTSIQIQSTQQPVQVSPPLLDAINESMKTNKSFRIDFDNDIAVIMRVDKNGVLSANFIPGSAAVENYLRNNIELLKQNFNDQNLPYNELSYSNRQKEKQSKHKENEDE